MIRYKPCTDSPDREHSFTGIDDRCMWCDAKPWYRSIRLDEGDTTVTPPVAPQPERVRPAAEYICACGHALWLHGNPPTQREPWGSCKAMTYAADGNPSRCDCPEAWPMEDQPRPCAECWLPAQDDKDLCVGHDRLYTYEPPTKPDEDGPWGGGFAANH